MLVAAVTVWFCVSACVWRQYVCHAAVVLSLLLSIIWTLWAAGAGGRGGAPGAPETAASVHGPASMLGSRDLQKMTTRTAFGILPYWDEAEALRSFGLPAEEIMLRRAQTSRWYRDMQSCGLALQGSRQPERCRKQRNLPEGVSLSSTTFGLSSHEIHERQALKYDKGWSDPTSHNNRNTNSLKKVRDMDRLMGSQSVASLIGDGRTSSSGTSTLSTASASSLRRSSTMGSLRAEAADEKLTSMPFCYARETRPDALRSRFLPVSHHSRSTPHAAAGKDFDSRDRTFIEQAVATREVERQRGDALNRLLHSNLSETALDQWRGTNLRDTSGTIVKASSSSAHSSTQGKSCEATSGACCDGDREAELCRSLLASNRGLRTPAFNVSSVGLYTGGESAIYASLKGAEPRKKPFQLPGPAIVKPIGEQTRAAEIEDGAGALVSFTSHRDRPRRQGRMPICNLQGKVVPGRYFFFGEDTPVRG